MIVDVSGDCEDNNNRSMDINNEINEKSSDNIFEVKKMKSQPKVQKSQSPEVQRPQSPQQKKEEGKKEKEETKKEEKKEEKKDDCNIF